MITQALSSDRTYEPSSLRISFAVRTITALQTAFFLMFPFGSAFLTETTIMSPTLAYRRFDHFKTLIQSTSFAPVLSTTTSLDSVCIISKI